MTPTWPTRPWISPKKQPKEADEPKQNPNNPSLSKAKWMAKESPKKQLNTSYNHYKPQRKTHQPPTKNLPPNRKNMLKPGDIGEGIDVRQVQLFNLLPKLWSDPNHVKWMTTERQSVMNVKTVSLGKNLYALKIC